MEPDGSGSLMAHLICFVLNNLWSGLPVSGVLYFYYKFLHQEQTKTKITVLLLGLCYFAACLILVLSRICRVPRKPDAKEKPSENVWDTDLEFVNDSEKTPDNTLSNPRTFLQNLLFKNPYEFSIFRPAYGMFLLTGLVSLAFTVFFLTIAEEWNDENDYFCAAIVLFPSSAWAISIVYLLSNSPFYEVKPRTDFYVPFHEYVNVPMQVKIRKAVTIFIAAGGTHFVLLLFVVLLILLGIVASDTVSELSGESLETVFHGFSFKPRKVIQVALASCIASCVIILIQMISSASVQAKKSILAIMEKNWERNLAAIQFILQDQECESLESLRAALDIKGNGELTRDELIAFRYITQPMWLTKQPFPGRWHKVFPEDVPAERLEEDIPQREQAVEEDPAVVEQEEQAVEEDPALVEQEEQAVEEDPAFVEQEEQDREEADTGSSDDEDEATEQEEEEVSERESRGYELRQRRPVMGEQSAPKHMPPRSARTRRR